MTGSVNVVHLRTKAGVIFGKDASSPSTNGGGGDNYDGMDARVTALEESVKGINAKLDRLLDGVSDARLDISSMKGKLDTMPSAMQFGELKGRVDSLPTTAKVAAIVAIVVGVVGLALRWTEITALLPT